jgi:uncharacterized membrane protein HdeD (DUF308 family)
MPSYLKALRWIAVVPAFVGAAALMRWMFDHAFALVFEEVAKDLSQSNGFAGHYILGPVYVFALSIASSSFSMAVGCWMAPDYRPIARIVLTVLIGCFLLTMSVLALSGERMHYDTEGWIRHVLVLLGSTLGIASSYKMEMRGDDVSLNSMLGIRED